VRQGDPVRPDLILACSGKRFPSAVCDLAFLLRYDLNRILFGECEACRFTWSGRGRNAGVDMLSRGVVRALLDRLRPPPRGWNNPGGPAMPPPPPLPAANRACLCSFGQSAAQGEGGRVMLPRKAGFIDLGAGRRFAPVGALKGGMGWQDGGGDGGFKRKLDGDALGIKAQVLTTPRHLLRDSEVLPLEEVGSKSLNGNGSCRRGKPLVFPEHPGAAKMVVAVDVDEGIMKNFRANCLFLKYLFCFSELVN
jgi:hypothetical protein